MNWSELKLSTNELAHNSHRLIPKDSHINNVIHCYFLFKVSECPVRHKANSLDLPLCTASRRRTAGRTFHIHSPCL